MPGRSCVTGSEQPRQIRPQLGCSLGHIDCYEVCHRYHSGSSWRLGLILVMVGLHADVKPATCKTCCNSSSVFRRKSKLLYELMQSGWVTNSPMTIIKICFLCDVVRRLGFASLTLTHKHASGPFRCNPDCVSDWERDLCVA